MADKKITELDSLAAASPVDILPIVAMPALVDTQSITVAALLSGVWPVGSVFTSILATNPATLLGFGTWAEFARGRVLVGVDPGDATIDAAEKTTGATTATPSAHAGTAVANHTDVLNHVHTLATGTTATGNFSQVLGTIDTSSGGTGATPTQTALGTRSGTPVGGVATQAHAVTQPDAHAALNVVQPSLAVFFWRRTA